MILTTVDALEALASVLDRTGGPVTLDRLVATLILSEMNDLRSSLADVLARDALGAALAHARQEADGYRDQYERALDEVHRLRRQLAETRLALAALREESGEHLERRKRELAE